jgi:hypothetical protein
MVDAEALTIHLQPVRNSNDIVAQCPMRLGQID